MATPVALEAEPGLLGRHRHAGPLGELGWLRVDPLAERGEELPLVAGARALREERELGERRGAIELARLVARPDRELERDREAKFGRLETELKRAGAEVLELASTTRRLADALASSRARGQWGERLAEDMLRAAGLVEGVSYRRQVPLADGGGRPDFTILLPQGRVVHLDVKFPFDNWQRSLAAADEPTRERHRAAFLRDVRARIAEVAGRDYIAPEAGTLTVALLFVPNEPVFAAMMDAAPGLLDEAMAKGVVLVSPTTLFATLAIVRQATESFRLAEAARDILEVLAAFRTAWQAYLGDSDRLGRRLEEAMRAYQVLAVVRREKLERTLARLDGLGLSRAAVPAVARNPQNPGNGGSDDGVPVPHDGQGAPPPTRLPDP